MTMTTTTVDEIAPEIFRIATEAPDVPVPFIQFLIRDESPLLYHTGGHAFFPDTVAAVGKLIDLADLRYISWSHLESDECGAVRDFLGVSPRVELVHGELAAMLGVEEFLGGPIRPFANDAVLELGERRLRFLVTPNVPHCWDAIMAYEETTGTLFCSDLFSGFGQQAAVTDRDIVERALEPLRQLPGYLAVGPHTAEVFQRLEALEPKVLAGHHSSAFTGDSVQALRNLKTEMFKMAGMPG